MFGLSRNLPQISLRLKRLTLNSIWPRAGMAETIGESVEDMMDDAVPEERTNDAKEDREEQSNEESLKS